MEILKIIETLQSYTEDVVAYKLDRPFAHAVSEAVSLLVAQGEKIAELEEQNRWIPVTERLPEDEKNVWSLCRIVRVLMYDGGTSVGFCNRGLKMWFHLPALGTTFVGYSFEKTPVVAWMPLPEQTKEG